MSLSVLVPGVSVRVDKNHDFEKIRFFLCTSDFFDLYQFFMIFLI